MHLKKSLVLFAIMVTLVPTHVYSISENLKQEKEEVVNPKQEVVVGEINTDPNRAPTTEEFNSWVDAMSIEYGQNKNLAKEIIRCESRVKHDSVGTNKRPDGTVWSRDVGFWQVNDYYHLKTAKTLGFDIYNWKDNIEYGFYLLQKDGTRHWNPSKYCWSHILSK